MVTRFVKTTRWFHWSFALSFVSLAATGGALSLRGLLGLLHVVRWSRDDLRWLVRQPLAALGRAELPPAGKLNAGQKVNALATAVLTLALAGSGLWLWRHPGAMVPLVVHVACFLAWIPLFAGHLFLALVAPGTRPALRGILLGRVPRGWARHHHARWVAELELEEGAPGSPRHTR
jgi:formate dehydrogenase subunit gamma